MRISGLVAVAPFLPELVVSLPHLNHEVSEEWRSYLSHEKRELRTSSSSESSSASSSASASSSVVSSAPASVLSPRSLRVVVSSLPTGKPSDSSPVGGEETATQSSASGAARTAQLSSPKSPPQQLGIDFHGDFHGSSAEELHDPGSNHEALQEETADMSGRAVGRVVRSLPKTPTTPTAGFFSTTTAWEKFLLDQLLQTNPVPDGALLQVEESASGGQPSAGSEDSAAAARQAANHPLGKSAGGHFSRTTEELRAQRLALAVHRVGQEHDEHGNYLRTSASFGHALVVVGRHEEFS